MKRLFINMGLFLWLVIGGVMIAGAESYPVYLNEDRNYILCDAYKETAWYLDRSSLNVQKYDPPQYIIAVNVVTVPDADRGGTDINGVRTFRFFYNYELKRMYVDLSLTDAWRYLDPNGDWAATDISLPVGELSFALAYNMKFYDSYDDSFYGRI